jgi:hypothetical protein
VDPAGQDSDIEHPDSDLDASDEDTPLSESLPDEDPLDEAVTDPNVLAEVTLPTRPGRFS